MFCPKCGNKGELEENACPSCGYRADPIHPGERVKQASKNALDSFKIFISNPVGDLHNAFESLGPEKALEVGITFGVAFAICLTLVSSLLISSIGNIFGIGLDLGIGGHIKIFIAALVPFISLSASGLIARSITHINGNYGQDCFIGGAALIPLGFLAIASSILGVNNLDIIILLAIFASCFTTLMLFSGLTKIYKMSEKQATIAVPAMFVLSAWIEKVIYAAILR